MILPLRSSTSCPPLAPTTWWVFLKDWSVVLLVIFEMWYGDVELVNGDSGHARTFYIRKAWYSKWTFLAAAMLRNATDQHSSFAFTTR